nr:sodium/hydrogen exchanger 9B2-like [Leptinotarsa decemlineata]
MLDTPNHSRNVSDSPAGYDNPGFEQSKSRKISSSSHSDGPVRKKSNAHKLNEQDNWHLTPKTKEFDSSRKNSETKYSETSTISRKTGNDSDSTWWYDLCLKCHSEEEGAKSWEPKFWSTYCPHPFCLTYRKFSRITSLIFIGAFCWAILYALVGESSAPPNGILFQLIVLSISAHFGGWLMGLTTLPALVGMLFTGVLLQNVNVINIDDSFSHLTKHLSDVALVIILTRAGLELDPSALKRLKYSVLRLSLVPWISECIVIALLSRYFLDLGWKYALLLGSIIAAVAPAVVVPCLFRLRSKGYGVAKGIPTLIIAVASIDDAASVAIFGIIKAIIFTDTSVARGVIFGSLSIVGGIVVGVIWGIICNFFPERNDPFVTPLRILLLLTGGLGAVFGSDLLGYSGAGPLACVTAGFVAMSLWVKHGWDIDDNPAVTAYEIFWMIFQPILFGITGARVKLSELHGNVVLIALGLLLASTVIRMMITCLVGIGCRLNMREKMFVSIAWMCKAIVQAALGPIALTLVEKLDDPKASQDAHRILTTTILSIILTAPSGALLTTLLGPHLLTKAKLPTLPDLKMRKKSRKMSFRDIYVDDDECFEGSNDTIAGVRMSVVYEENEVGKL